MKTYFEFFYQGEQKCMVEMYSGTECTAQINLDGDTVLQHDFNLNDVPASFVGYYLDMNGNEQKMYWNPFADGFEYCEKEVIEYLESANFEIVQL